MASYLDYLTLLAPPWLLQPNGKAWLQSFGQVLDDAGVARLQASVLAHIIERAPVDALARLGDDRLLERYPGETDDGYRARLLAVFSAWQQGGTELGVATALRTAFPGGEATILENRDWVPAPPDGDTSKWNRFWVIFSGTLPPTWQPTYWGGGGAWGGGGSWGSTIPAADIVLLRALIKKWKPAHSICAGIFVIFSGNIWGPFAAWGSPGRTWGGITVSLGGVT